MNYNVIYNGIKYGEKGLAHCIYENVMTKGMSVKQSIDAQIKWVLDNCSGVNDIFLSNSLGYLWYDLMGIHSSIVDKETQSAISSLVDKGQIYRW